jgi:hypothetical protein
LEFEALENDDWSGCFELFGRGWNFDFGEF